MSQTLTIRIPDELRKELDEIAKKERTPMSEIVRRSIERDLALRRFRVLRRKILPFAEASGFVSDDDVFRAVS